MVPQLKALARMAAAIRTNTTLSPWAMVFLDAHNQAYLKGHKTANIEDIRPDHPPKTLGRFTIGPMASLVPLTRGWWTGKYYPIWFDSVFNDSC